ncbi:MAG: ABC transporter permease subunit [Deltaproteobacteria bacterium]|nr:ABC transporter permease subunit [Deltaproteobacteria bacterium]
MKGFWPVFKRDLFSTFVTPVAWVTIFVFLLLQGANFYLLVAHFTNQVDIAIDRGPVQWFFADSILQYFPLLMLAPALTMRSLAEERRSGTIEGLLTTPVSTPAVVLAKWAAAFVTYLAVWAPTLLYMIVLKRAGEVDWRVVASCYLGVALLGAAFTSLGVLMSAMTRSQVVALLLSLAAVIGLLIVGIGEMIFDNGPAHDLCAYVSILSQMADFSKGLIDTRRVIFDLTLTAAPLFITVRAVDAWRWG